MIYYAHQRFSQIGTKRCSYLNHPVDRQELYVCMVHFHLLMYRYIFLTDITVKMSIKCGNSFPLCALWKATNLDWKCQDIPLTRQMRSNCTCPVQQSGLLGFPGIIMTGLLCKAGTLIISLQKLQLQPFLPHCVSLKRKKKQENPTYVHKEEFSSPSICWSEWVNGSLKAELCDHGDNGVFYYSLQPFRRLFLKQWQPL